MLNRQHQHINIFSPNVCIKKFSNPSTSTCSQSVKKSDIGATLLLLLPLYSSEESSSQSAFFSAVAHRCCHPGVHDHDGHLSHRSPRKNGGKNQLPGRIARYVSPQLELDIHSMSVNDIHIQMWLISR